MTSDTKLERWAERELKRNLHHLIVEDDSDGYIAFGKYYLKPEQQLMRVYARSGELIAKFSNKRTAISWCVADNKNHLRLARDIKNLDSKKLYLEADIHCRRQLAEQSPSNSFAETVLTKLQPKVQQQAMINQELEKCLNMAKYLQLRGFQNETARTSGHQAN